MNEYDFALVKDIPSF